MDNLQRAIHHIQGCTSKSKKINPGDFISTSYESAKSWAGTGNVISKEVKMRDILDDITEPLGGDYIYRPQ